MLSVRSLACSAYCYPLALSHFTFLCISLLVYHFATPNRCNNISLFSALLFVILLIRACPSHYLVRPWEKKDIEPEDQYLYLSQTCSLAICVALLSP